MPSSGGYPFQDDVTAQGLGILGYVIFKREVQPNGAVESKPTILIVNRDQESYSDVNVKYGTTYRYDIHPLCILRTVDDSGVDEHFLIIGTEAKTATINTIENIPPAPVESIRFDWTGTQLALNWGMPMTRTNELGGPIGDIKGYQIFCRDSINRPFELKKFLTFYDGLTPFTSAESYGKYVEPYKYHTSYCYTYIEPDMDYIFAICTIDAHGNSSNLSPQYKVRLDSQKNEIVTEFISFKGAPKQYPNFMMSEKIFLDAIKTSGAKKMTVYLQPDAVTTSYPGSATSEEQILNINDGSTPAYRIQLINVNTQSDDILNIFLPNSL